MKKSKRLFAFSVFFLFLGSILFFWNDLVDIYLELSLKLPRVEKEIAEFLIKETEKQILTPPPLRAEKEALESLLTRTGVIQWTNSQREKYGFSSLIENEKLNIMAEVKVQDMFKNQYFAHYSLTGIGAKDMAESNGYEFISIGENLALGNFQNDKTLVQGWMDSPGHRENILNESYQEIGVAVLKGIFDGKSTWLAVQHFGLPLSACPQPDETIAIRIELNQNEIEELQKTLKALRAEIRFIKPKYGSGYNQKVDQYNNLISQYNALLEETEILINQYNNRIKLFNECATGVK